MEVKINMNCPRCELGKIIKIRMRKDGRTGSLCEYCGSLWFAGDTIDFQSGHFLASYSSSDDREYTIEEISGKEQELESVNYSDFR
jgi:hypothetical protein